MQQRSFAGGGRVRRFAVRRFAPLFLIVVLVVVFALTAFALTRSADPFAAGAVVDPPFPSLTYGIQAFLWWDENIASVHLAWVRMMSFSHVKQIFAWEDLEPEPGLWSFVASDRIVDQAESYGLHLVVRLSDAPDWSHPSVPGRRREDFIDAPPDAQYMDAWANYCGTVAARYRGRISAYQIWNEPNLSREWGNREPNAAEFVELLRRCSAAIRAADPAAILISAGLATTGNQDVTAHRDDIFLQEMYDAGFQQYIDVVGAHAPGYRAPEYGPDDAERDGFGRWSTFRRIEDLRKIMVRNGDAARQMAILELGWTTDQREDSQYRWFAVDEAQQADYLVRAYQYAAAHWRPWVGLMSTIYIADPAWTPDDEEYWWAVTATGIDWSPPGITRPAYLALASMPKYCGDQVIAARDGDYLLPNDVLQIPVCAG
ncbi:MAG: cellulase family glycosylhydrolase [Chloroflexi bacterium]|nr:cellulase family glycosylhydrolase [Chloroflexota bacterium]